MPIAKILIANRGEIACRVIRTARTLGVETVAVHTDADAKSPHVGDADEAVRIGEGPVGDSYLNIQKILEAAKISGADAIHPGYGFLSENAAFAEAAAEAGLVFIGPPAAAIAAMGDKAEAKRRMIEADVPCVPGYQDVDQSDAALEKAAEAIGFPIMVKAAAGGGGRGMRLVGNAGDLAQALGLARSEALGAFGSDVLILEKAIQRPRHVEMQIFADDHGNVIHLGERDCSVQRRHQKVVEEAPCPVMTDALRAEMGAAACAAARAVDYRGAGTVEFLLDESGSFYFLEMNTRLQVEHPVTEMVTGLDLVALQIAVANGEALPLAQEDVALDGHAIEVRLYAEDPANDFRPDTGRVDLWRPAPGDGLRFDSGVAEGQDVSPFYDPMIAKIIAHGPTRDMALKRLIGAVQDNALLGPATNATFLADILSRERFARGEATTAFIDDEFPDGVRSAPVAEEEIALAGALVLSRQRDAAFAASGYVSANQLGWAASPMAPTPLTLEIGGEEAKIGGLADGLGWRITVNERIYAIDFEAADAPNFRARIDGARREGVHVWSDAGHLRLAIDARRISARVKGSNAADAEAAGGRVTAPMPGLVMDVLVSEGDRVEPGATLAVLEAMKMQHRIEATVAGVVSTVAASSGAQIAAGDLMVEISEE